ncbi:MAG: hypothetical protein IAG10_23500 [Planctomycetaceae bacterium]|nr:hypothetical protein [Planctomycetaceae bacterium]
MKFVVLVLGFFCVLVAWVPGLTRIADRPSHGPYWMKSRWVWSSIGLLLMLTASTAWFRNDAPIERAERPNSQSHIARCAECHAAQTDLFLEVPHAQTLRRADQPSEWARFTGQAVRIGDPAVEFRYWERGGRLWGGGERAKTPAVVDWIFGSGHHGQTAVTVRTNDRGEPLVLEHHVTWYAAHGLDRTISRPLDLGRGKDEVGELNNPETSRRCFGCHTTLLPENEHRIDLEQLVPGVLCSRCHSGADQHADAMKSGSVASEFNDWRKLSPFQSVARCGECHRLPTSFSPNELTPKNQTLPRFAPVGLLMSKCFQLQHTQPQPGGTTRLDCVTCHDPHRPTPTDPNHYNRSCQQCHRGDSTSQVSCPKQPLDSNCIGCHMPKVAVDAPTLFTDHWIRVPESKP